MASEALDRAEVARGLEKELDGIKAAAEEFCLPDAALAILRLEDVYDDWKNAEYGRLLHPDRSDQDEVQTAAYLRRAGYLIDVGDYALALLLENGKQCGRQFKEFPHIYDIISTMKPFESVQEGFRSGKIKPSDAYFVTEVNILGTIPTTEILILENGAGTEAEHFMGQILDWHKKLLIYITKRRAVRKGKELRLENAQTGKMLVTEGVHTDSELFDIMMNEQATPRHVVGTAWNAPTWASEFQDVSRENYRDIDTSRDPAVNLDFTLRETDEIAKGYGAFPGFKSSFSESYGVDFDSLTKVDRALVKLVMGADQHVYYGKMENVLAAVKIETKLADKECRRVIEFMTWKHGEQPIRKPIYATALYRYTSFRRLSAARTLLMESHFRGIYTKQDEKGRIFENRCRDLLRESGLGVYPKRLEVPFQIVPSEVSKRLWGKAKTQTDLDVLGTKGRIGFIIECKEVKIELQRLTKKTNLFLKYIIELYYKSLWISGNRLKFTELLGTQAKLFADVDYLIPLVITTFPFDVGPSSIALLTFPELETIAKSIDKIKVEVEGNRSYARLPWRGEETSVSTLALPLPS